MAVINYKTYIYKFISSLELLVFHCRINNTKGCFKSQSSQGRIKKDGEQTIRHDLREIREL